jgi:hypothetical protein
MHKVPPRNANGVVPRPLREERGRNGTGKLSPCEDSGSSLKWVGGNMGKGSGKRVGDEGRRADDEAEAVGLPCRWAGEMVVLCEYIKDGEAGTVGLSSISMSPVSHVENNSSCMPVAVNMVLVSGAR